MQVYVLSNSSRFKVETFFYNFHYDSSSSNISTDLGTHFHHTEAFAILYNQHDMDLTENSQYFADKVLKCSDIRKSLIINRPGTREEQRLAAR